ncbi:unnamed protein product [Closterium sp. Yama58-4]|nr:unnamed protein product [Closterium sp. Yama58-4]
MESEDRWWEGGRAHVMCHDRECTRSKWAGYVPDVATAGSAVTGGAGSGVASDAWVPGIGSGGPTEAVRLGIGDSATTTTAMFESTTTPPIPPDSVALGFPTGQAMLNASLGVVTTTAAAAAGAGVTVTVSYNILVVPVDTTSDTTASATAGTGSAGSTAGTVSTGSGSTVSTGTSGGAVNGGVPSATPQCQDGPYVSAALVPLGKCQVKATATSKVVRINKAWYAKLSYGEPCASKSSSVVYVGCQRKYTFQVPNFQGQMGA